jgi:hypothetical protein
MKTIETIRNNIKDILYTTKLFWLYFYKKHVFFYKILFIK